MRLVAISLIVFASLASLVSTVGGTAALAMSQPDHRPHGFTIWFQPSQVIIEGTHMIENGRVEDGMAMIRQEMKRNLDYADLVSAINNLCVGHLALKQYQKAFDLCSQAIKLKPSMWEGHNNRGNARLGLGNYAMAIPDYEKAMELNPESITVQSNLALAHRYLDQAKALTQK